MKQFLKYFICFLLICTMSCEKDYGTYELPETGEGITTPEEFLASFGDQISANFIGRILDENKNPIEGVTIQVSNSTATTDAFGVFSITNADVYERFAYVKASKNGYINGSRTLVPLSSETNQVEIVLLTKSITATINSGETSSVTLNNGSEVTFDGNFIAESGEVYNGAVNVTVKHLSPDDSDMNRMMPGMLFAQNTSGAGVALETYGMLAVELTTAGGETLQLAENSRSKITIPLASNVVNPPQTMPLWYFDEETGYWVEDGEATLQGNQYIGEVSHFTFWNYDFPYPAVYVCITLVDVEGNALSNTALDLYSELLNVTGTYGFTDADGVECGLVPEGEEMTLSVYSPLCAETPFTTTIGPFSTDSNTTVVVDFENEDITFTGNFLNCDGENVTNGYVQLSIDGNSQIIPVTDGEINYMFNACGAVSYTYKGIDLENSQETDVFSGTIADGDVTIDAGEFSACQVFEDSDGDSIPDSLEDINGDNNLNNDDTDQDGIPDYLDADDDGDGVNTIDEDYDGDNNPTNDDTDDDGIPNYLDSNDLNIFESETGSDGCDPVIYNFEALMANVYNTPNTTYVFYETEADANAETNAVTTPYTLEYAEALNNPIIYVRGESTVTGQSDIAEIYLFLNDFDSDNDGLTDCEEITGVNNPNTNLTPSGTSDPNDVNDPIDQNTNNPNDGFLYDCVDNNVAISQFDLSQMNSFYANGNADVEISYHFTESDASNGINSLLTNFQNTVNPQTLFVRIFNLTTGEFDIATLVVEVSQNPEIPNDLQITACDEATDGVADSFAIFDLTSIETEILGANTGANLSITYFDAGGNPITDTQNYFETSGTVSIEVLNVESNCLTIGVIELVVDTGC